MGLQSLAGGQQMTIDEPVHQADYDLAVRGGGVELEELGERIAELAAQISAATYELLSMLREFDERAGWGGGFRSCAHWLCWRIGLDPGAAREKVRVARALGALPLLSGAMCRGEICYSKGRALSRIATPANEEELLRFGRAGSAAHGERERTAPPRHAVPACFPPRGRHGAGDGTPRAGGRRGPAARPGRRRRGA